jgi:hypothetical protein
MMRTNEISESAESDVKVDPIVERFHRSYTRRCIK